MGKKEGIDFVKIRDFTGRRYTDCDTVVHGLLGNVDVTSRRVNDACVADVFVAAGKSDGGDGTETVIGLFDKGGTNLRVSTSDEGFMIYFKGTAERRALYELAKMIVDELAE